MQLWRLPLTLAPRPVLILSQVKPLLPLMLAKPRPPELRGPCPPPLAVPAVIAVLPLPQRLAELPSCQAEQETQTPAAPLKQTVRLFLGVPAALALP